MVKKWMAVGLMLASVGVSAQQTIVIPGRFNPAMNGEVVDDWVKGIRWKRCVEGMNWDANAKTCTGKPALFTHDEAKALVASTPGWGLPSPSEYRGLVECGAGEVRSIITESRWANMPYACSSVTNSPTINQAVFPNTPAEGHWAQARLKVMGYAEPSWAMDFSQGLMAPTAGFYKYHVRLMNYQAADVRDEYLADQHEQRLYNNATDIDSMELYLSVLPEGKRANEVRTSLDDQLFAQATDPAGSMAYLERFPEGRHAKAAGAKLDDQLAAKATSVAGMVHYLTLLPKGEQAGVIRTRLESTLFDRATHEAAMEQYLAHFPSGARSSTVKASLEELRLVSTRSALAQHGYLPAERGAAAYQQTSGLTWARCSVGQSWNPTRQACTGKPSLLTHGDLSSITIPEGWRLPTASELMLIRKCELPREEFNRQPSCYSKNLMINRTVFPGTPEFAVTGTLSKNVPYLAADSQWVGFLKLDAYERSRSGKGFVRLVKGEVQNVAQLCGGIEHYFYEAKTQRQQYEKFSDRIAGVPADSFEYRWRTEARKLVDKQGSDHVKITTGNGHVIAEAKDALIHRCVSSFYQESDKGEGV